MKALKKLTPNLMVRDVRRSVAFYVDVLGFEPVAFVSGENGMESGLVPGRRYVWALVRSGAVEVMLQAEESLRTDVEVLSKCPIGSSATLYCETDDVGELYGRVRAGAEIVKELSTAWYGADEFYVRDPDGYVLAFAQARAGT